MDLACGHGRHAIELAKKILMWMDWISPIIY